MEQKILYLKKPRLAEGKARAAGRGIFMLLGEAQAAKFRSEVLQPVFLGSSKFKKKTQQALW